MPCLKLPGGWRDVRQARELCRRSAWGRKASELLQSPRARARDGYDVVIGVAEPDGRKETEACWRVLKSSLVRASNIRPIARRVVYPRATKHTYHGPIDRDDESGKIQALDLGADDHVTKSFRMDEFVARMCAALPYQLHSKKSGRFFVLATCRSISCETCRQSRDESILAGGAVGCCHGATISSCIRPATQAEDRDESRAFTLSPD